MAFICSQVHIKIRVMKIGMADYVYLVIQKSAVWIRISLDTNAKTVATPNLQIGWNGTCMEMFLTVQVVLVIYPVIYFVMLFVNKQ